MRVTRAPGPIGVVSQADLASEIEKDKVGELVEAISAAP